MQIDYWNEFQELQEKDTFSGEQWFGERKRLVEEYSWAVPTREVISYLADFDALLEVGAGNGYWAHLIEKAGGTVVPIDVNVPEDTYTSVIEAHSTEYYGEYERSPVLMVWPPYGEPMASDIAKRGPPHILYVGAGRGGCTASKSFFDVVDREYARVERMPLPSYEGIHDEFHHYARKIE